MLPIGMIISFLSNNYVKFFAIPLLTTLLAVFVKMVSRNDKDVFIKKEDFAIGLDISVTALLLLLTDTLNYASRLATEKDAIRMHDTEKLISVSWLMVIFVVGLWGMSTLIRKKGWNNPDEMHWGYGIIVPNIFGLTTLIFVVNWITG